MRKVCGAAAVALATGLSFIVPVAPASAAPILFDFTGFGGLCSFAECHDENFFGSITLEVLAPGPSGPDSWITQNAAFDPYGWVSSDFQINWAGGSFNPTPFGDMTSVANAAQLSDAPSGSGYTDSVFIHEEYSFYSPETGDRESRVANLYRQGNADLFTGLQFPIEVDLAIGPDAINRLSFHHSGVRNGEQAFSLIGDIFLSTMTQRRTEVPEPAPGLLLLGGLAAIGFSRRRTQKRP